MGAAGRRRREFTRGALLGEGRIRGGPQAPRRPDGRARERSSRDDEAARRRYHRRIPRPGRARPAGDPMNDANPVDVVQRQLEAYNARDLERFAATYAADVTI